MIPKTLRDQLGLRAGAALDVRVERESLVLEPIPQSAVVSEVDGLLVVGGTASAWPDHRDLREERLGVLAAEPDPSDQRADGRRGDER